MKVEIEQYAANRKLVKNLLQRKGNDSYKDIASEFSVTASIPVFVTYFYIGEIIGFNPWIVQRMKALSKFYGYTEIIVETDLDLKQFTERKDDTVRKRRISKKS